MRFLPNSLLSCFREQKDGPATVVTEPAIAPVESSLTTPTATLPAPPTPFQPAKPTEDTSTTGPDVSQIATTTDLEFATIQQQIQCKIIDLEPKPSTPLPTDDSKPDAADLYHREYVTRVKANQATRSVTLPDGFSIGMPITLSEHSTFAWSVDCNVAPQTAVLGQDSPSTIVTVSGDQGGHIFAHGVVVSYYIDPLDRTVRTVRATSMFGGRIDVLGDQLMVKVW